MKSFILKTSKNEQIENSIQSELLAPKEPVPKSSENHKINLHLK